MQDIGVGLIGYGLGGRAFHAPFVRATPGMALRAVVSRDAAKVHADLPAMTVVPDVATLLATPGIDLVVVSSPDELHAEHALAAIAAGKHVLVDKPFATTLADARAIAAAGDAAGRVVTVFQNRRWDSDFLTLKRLSADGMLGEIVQFESHFDRWRPEVPAIWKEARIGGTWQDLGPHLVDQALQLFGRPESVSADIATLRDGAPGADYFHVGLRYPRRRVLLHSSKLVVAHSLRFAVHGTRGSWIKHGLDTQEAATSAGRLPGAGDDWGVDPVEGMLTRPDATTIVVPNARGDYRQLWHQLAAAIRGEGANPVPASDGVEVIEIIEAGLLSAAQRAEVAL
jgi:predicted dehydrogenase